ncbi:MAG: hypothetical protein DHS20C18_34130 [Saprospiraceae bacterium]|nr:MAG: hypothetical protein DHS20C18_34130 [Saprospiraceae bacterium]
MLGVYASQAQENQDNRYRLFNPALYQGLQWRNIGPFRGGRSVAVSGVPGNPMTYYMGSTGGGVWKTEDAGLSWKNISDGVFKAGSIGAISVAESDPNIIYVGTGEHAVRGVMTSHGDGIYKSTDSGKTWKYIGLPDSRQIAEIRINPQDPNIVFVAVQGSIFGRSEHRGVYKSTDGGGTWRKVLYINETTGASDLSMDSHNPRILYAGTWDHQRFPWTIRSGGDGSGIYKSIDGGESWERLIDGLPEKMGKVSVDVSRVNSDIVYANIEAEMGGVYRSNDGGKNWERVNADRITYARAWYYIEIFTDPVDTETVYVLNAPMLKSTDGGKTFSKIANPHGDQHHLWINPENNNNIILANDGGACITFNGGKSWSSQQNQPTGQFYRVIADKQFPYYVYGGQQDNSTVAIASRTSDKGIDEKDWYPVSGGESAFIAFNPDSPEFIYGGSYQGNISVYDNKTKNVKDIMAYPQLGLATTPRTMKYRFNWNAPIVSSPQNPDVIYHAGNLILRTADGGQHWKEISPDLTRNDSRQQGPGGYPFTNEGAGGENYNTISYLACSPHESKTLWVGTDDGLIHITRNEGKQWTNITPPELQECLINCIEISPHKPGVAYVVATRYKFDDLKPIILHTKDYGQNWELITDGIGPENFVRVVREDPKVEGILYAGTENGLYISVNNGLRWHRFQLNLPICPINDLTIRDNDLIAATSGRGFWILDDLSSIQQGRDVAMNGHMLLFKPKPTVKFITSSGNQDVEGQGTNPLPGLIIDFYLPKQMDSSELKLEIVDKAGNVIRRYSNQKDPDFVKYEGGPKPAPILPFKRGVNRFNWDLRRAPIPNVAGVFMLGDYGGSTVGPGDYIIRLTGPFTIHETTCKILPDPRIKISPTDYADQQEILVTIDNVVKDIHHAVSRMRAVKKQIGEYNIQLKNNETAASVVDKGKDIIDKLDRWEENLIQPHQKTYQDVINFPNGLNSELINLRSRVDTQDPTVTSGARQRLKDLLDDWSKYQSIMDRIIEDDVAEFNRLFRVKDLPALVVPSADADKP